MATPQAAVKTAPRLELRGFYFDPEKGKYFRIIPDHVAPANVKYSHSEVSHRRVMRAKQRIVSYRQHRLARETVARSDILKHPALARIGLQREQGCSTGISQLSQWEVHYFCQLQPITTSVSRCNSDVVELTDVIHLDHSRQSLAAFLHHGDASSVEQLPTKTISGETSATVSADRLRVAAFTSPVVSMSAVRGTCDLDDRKRLLVCAQRPVVSGNVYFGFVFEDPTRTSNGFYMQLGSANSSLWASSINATTGSSAIVGSSDIFVLTESGAIRDRRRLRSESRDVAWYDLNTVCFGQDGQCRDNEIVLWDLRTKSSDLRVKGQGPITGIRTRSEWYGFLSSDNKGVYVHDVRMGGEPLLSFTHTHYGPRLQFDLLTASVFAAIDHKNIVRIHSLSFPNDHPQAPHAQGKFPSEHRLMNLRSQGERGFYASRGKTLVCWNDFET